MKETPAKKNSAKKASTKKKPASKSAKMPVRKRSQKRSKEPRPYVMPKTAAELGIVCAGGNSGKPCNLPVIWFDYEIGEKRHMQGFVCDAHKVSNRVEKLAQPTAASAV